MACVHQSGARGRSGSGGPWRRFVIALCSMQRISDRRPSAVPKSKYPRNALCTPDVESRLVRSTLSMRPADLAARPPASFDDPSSWETANRPCPRRDDACDVAPTPMPSRCRPQASGNCAPTSPTRRGRPDGSGPPAVPTSASTEEGRRRLRPSTYQACVTPQRSDPLGQASSAGLESLTRGHSSPRRRRGPSGAAPRRRSRELPPYTGRALSVNVRRDAHHRGICEP